MPTNGAVYVETKAIVSGTLNGRVTIAANDDMIVGGDIAYTQIGDDVLGLIGKNDVIIASWAPSGPSLDLTWRAAVITQNGARHSWNSCNCKGTATHWGSSASNQHPFMDMFQTRNYNYDTTLQWLPPPWFPVLDASYTVSLFREVNPRFHACRAGLIRRPISADMQTVNLALAALALPPALAFGSFVNVVAARVPLRRSIAHPRSACLACDARRSLHVTTSRCSRTSCCTGVAATVRRRSRRSIPRSRCSRQSSSSVCVLDFGATAYAALAAFFCVTLVTLSAADLRYRLVPNRIVMPAFVICLLAHTAIDPSVEWVAAALAASTLMLVFALIHPAGLGMGDVKLTLLLGAMLGRTVGAALLIGFVAALVPSLVLLARHGSKARKMAIPLVPFLALGALVALFSVTRSSTGIRASARDPLTVGATPGALRGSTAGAARADT